MEVICVNDKSSIDLIEGKVYIVKRVILNWRKVWIIDIFGLSNSFELFSNIFTNLDGTPIPLEKYENRGKSVNIYEDELEEGMLLECINKYSKTLSYGKFYTIKKVENFSVSLEEVYKTNKQGNKVHRFYKIYSFRKVSPTSVRDIKLNNLITDYEDERLKNYKNPYIKYLDKISLLLNEVGEAIKLIDKTEMKNVSIIEVIRRRIRDKNIISEEDFKELDDINWEKLLTKNIN